MHTIMSAQSNGTYYGVRTGDSSVMRLSLYGTWDGATATVRISDDRGVTWRDFYADGTLAAYSANDEVTIDVGPGQRYGIVVSAGGGSTSLTAKAGGRFIDPIATATA
jgi:hypothetical protein